MKFGEMTEERKEDVVKMLTDSFFDSQELTQAFHDAIIELQPSPMSVVFAGMVVDKMMRQQVPDWDKIRDFGIQGFKSLDESGMLEDLKTL